MNLAADTQRTVYFLGATSLSVVKIGCSSMPMQRWTDLRHWSPVPLDVLASAPGTMRDERYIQSMFADSWSHFEWFHLTPGLLALIDEVKTTGRLPARAIATDLTGPMWQRPDSNRAIRRRERGLQ